METRDTFVFHRLGRRYVGIARNTRNAHALREPRAAGAFNSRICYASRRARRIYGFECPLFTFPTVASHLKRISFAAK